ncbi:MAG: CPBP family intramembrane metalloprotease [Clostridia bacterium]|nr:CPBP family intramembrane metalloprotease [Clostridia bacterium]
MSKSKKLVLVSLIAMIVISLCSVFNIKNLSSLVLVIGLVMYFVSKKSGESEDYLSFKEIPKSLKDFNVIILMVMPIVSGFLSTFLAQFVMPGFADHVSGRTSFVPTGNAIMLVPMLLIAACGEEIAMRGFMQAQLEKYIKFVPALIITSLLFAMCHISTGPVLVVLYDLAFIAIDAIFYGLIFTKTRNLWICTLSHFAANLICILFFL